MRGVRDDMDASPGGPHYPPPPSVSRQECDYREPSETLPVLRDSSQLPGVRTQFLEAAQEVISGIHQGMSVLGVRQSAARGLPVAHFEGLEAVRQTDVQTLDQALVEIQRLRAALRTTQACVSLRSSQRIHVQQQSASQSPTQPIMPQTVERTQPEASSSSQAPTGRHCANPLPAPHSDTGSHFHFAVKPREPPTFSGDRGQDVTRWLDKVNDFLALTKLPEEQAVIYTIMLLKGNAEAWWRSEFQKRGNTRPRTAAELQQLIRTAFDSPLREQRALTELLRLQQKRGETVSSYMARLKTILYKISFFDDEQTALH